MTHGERLAALAAQLDGLAARLEAERDSRCVYTYAYAFMTRRLAAELPTAGMTDPEWVVALAETFGARYVTAVTAWDDDRASVPAGWAAVFETNRVMGHTVDDMQAAIGERYAHYLRWLDRVGRAQNELLSNYGTCWLLRLLVHSLRRWPAAQRAAT